MSIIQYLKDTRGELHHVAWPTRLQTIVYTALVILISIFIALYLGFFDYIFTTGLGRGLQFLPGKRAPSAVELPLGTSTATIIQPPAPKAPTPPPATPGAPSFQ